MMISVKDRTKDTEVAELVQLHLKRLDTHGLQLEVLAQAVRREDDWWYVPVRSNSALPRTYEYYDILAEVEEEITETEHLEVLLVPSD